MGEQELWRGRPSLWNIKTDVYKLVKTMLLAGVLLYCSRYIPENTITVPDMLPDMFSGMRGDQFYLLLLFSILVVRRVISLIKHYINILCIEIRLTEERLSFREGILNKVEKGVELYRIKDWSLSEPFLFRLLGLQNIHIVTADCTLRSPKLMGMPKKDDLYGLLNKYVEAARLQKGVKEIDYYGR